MKYYVQFTKTSETDLQNVSHYIAYVLHNPTAAKRLVAGVRAGVARLDSNPKSRPLVNDDSLAAKGIRWISVRNYMVFYVVDEHAHNVYILHVMHGRRDWVHLLQEETDEQESALI
jgi:toxin ParE1/3/4